MSTMTAFQSERICSRPNSRLADQHELPSETVDLTKHWDLIQKKDNEEGTAYSDHCRFGPAHCVILVSLRWIFDESFKMAAKKYQNPAASGSSSWPRNAQIQSQGSCTPVKRWWGPALQVRLQRNDDLTWKHCSHDHNSFPPKLNTRRRNCRCKQALLRQSARSSHG